MSDPYDVAIVGLGAIGSAAAASLAARGRRVLGLDRWVPPHVMASSHGESRMIREAYYQGSLYLPLVQAAYARWRELERASGRPLLRITRALMIGEAESRVFGGSLATALEQGLDHERLSAAEVRERFPPFRLEPGTEAVLEPHAGVLDVAGCLEVLLAGARERGAALRCGERLTGWRAGPDGIRLRTDAAEHRARRAIFAAGAWTGGLLPELGAPLEVERTVQFWFDPIDTAAAARLDPERCPAWVWEYGSGTTWYGFPRLARGVKTGMHVEGGRLTDPDAVRRDVGPPEEEGMRGVLGRFMPDAAGKLRDASVCFYTNTPDEHFVLDRHPKYPEIAVFAGGSGHAFKFAPVLGEILGDLITDREPGFDLTAFRLDRFA